MVEILVDIALPRIGVRTMPSNRDISPKEIAQWFRDRARQFGEIASMMEATFGAGTPAAKLARSRELVFDTPIPGEPITADSFKAVLRHANFRVKGLAHAFAIHEDDVLHIINTPNSGLTVAERGWVKVTTQPKT
jgi:hypothetical protein